MRDITMVTKREAQRQAQALRREIKNRTVNVKQISKGNWGGHVGWSGVCDDCTLGLEPMTCLEIKTDMEYFGDEALE